MHRCSQAFKLPVNPQVQAVPDYHDVVYCPMDLQSIGRKVRTDRYCQLAEFHADINRIFLNSYKYNLRETQYFQTAIEFEDHYHQLLDEALKHPEEYAKELPPKPKKGDHIGELDYTENTPLKNKKKSIMKVGQVKSQQP
jgi:hypothetical protein